MKLLLKLITGTLTSVGAAIVAREIYVTTYVYFHGGIRSDYSEDYGLAFDVVLIQIITFLIVAIACFFYLKRQR